MLECDGEVGEEDEGEGDSGVNEGLGVDGALGGTLAWDGGVVAAAEGTTAAAAAVASGALTGAAGHGESVE